MYVSKYARQSKTKQRHSITLCGCSTVRIPRVLFAAPMFNPLTPNAMTTIEKVCNFIGLFMLLGLTSLKEDPKPSFIFTYLLITAFFLTAGRAWRINRK